MTLNDQVCFSFDLSSRYLTITRPFTYAVKRRTGRSLFLIFCVWMLSAFICLPPLLVLGNEHGTPEVPICELCKNFVYQLYATLGKFFNSNLHLAVDDCLFV